MTNVYVKGGLKGAAIIAAACGAVYYFNPSVPVVDWSKIDNPLKRESLAPVADKPLPAQEGCDDQLTLKVVKNIREHPEQWTVDKYRMERDGGALGKDVKIWIANADYGLDFLSDRRYSTEGVKYPFTDECRAYLYDATNGRQAIAQEEADRAAKAEALKERKKIEDALKGI